MRTGKKIGGRKMEVFAAYFLAVSFPGFHPAGDISRGLTPIPLTAPG
jgi:hypothetical protein